MNKTAQALYIIQKHMEKRAGTNSDMFLGGLSTLIPGIGIYGPAVGTAAGLLGGTPDVKDIQKMDRRAVLSAVPGFGVSNLIRRRKALRKLLKDNPDSFDSSSWLRDTLGPVSNAATYSILGNRIGALCGSALGESASGVSSPLGYAAQVGDALSTGLGTYSDTLGGLSGGITPRDLGAIGGQAAGLGISALGTLGGALSAALTRRRTLSEQAAVENSKSRKFLHALVPGLASYDFWKGLGAAKHLSERSIDEIQRDVDAIRQKRLGSDSSNSDLARV